MPTLHAKADAPRKSPGLVLVIYGVPPDIKLHDATGQSLGSFVLTKDNRTSFEAALRQALAAFMQADAAIFGARFIYVESVADIAAAIKSADYTQVIYYGHGMDGVNALLPTRQHSVIASQLAQALRETKVTHFDILGCKSVGIAAELATLVPKLRVGNLREKRFDNIETNHGTQRVVQMTIDPQKIFHFGGGD